MSRLFKSPSRRDLLRLARAGSCGASASGWLPVLANQAAQAAKNGRQHKSCILLYMVGGPSHIDTFDEKPKMVWHQDSEVPDVDLIVVPGGFSYGDYLRCGAMAAQSRIMKDIKAKADKGVSVLGICNGFQILTESGLLPG